VCPFTLEPIRNCRIRKIVFGRKQCPFSLEACQSVLSARIRMGDPIRILHHS
jgi:hypothetical protein